MPISSEQELRDLMGGLEGVSSARITLTLDTARIYVRAGGVPETHADFAVLQRLYAAHLLDAGGAVGGAIASKSVGDVSESYARGGMEESSWLGLYRQIRAQIIALRGRIA